MLIQAQCQKDREKKCKITANDVEIRNEQSSNAAASTATDEQHILDDDADVEMSEIAELTDTKEMGKMDTDAKLEKRISDESENTTNNNNSMATSKNSSPEISTKIDESASSSKEFEQQESNDQTMAEHSSEPIRIEESVQTNDDDPYSGNINIDPRTYCKLGHFHLLLEDYPKGKL